MDGFVSDSIPYFRTSNRYRDIALSRDGMRIYLITDSIGQTSGPSGNGTSALDDRGAIIEYMYTGTTLALGAKPMVPANARKLNISVYPNPASDWIMVSLGDGIDVRPVHYRLVDLAGRIVVNGITAEKQFKINIRNLGTGMYMLKLYNGNGFELDTEKIIVR
jgi:hypothetical protein